MKGSLPYLQILAKSKPKLRKILIENVPQSVITAIYECCLNTLKGVIPLTQRQKRRLAPYETHLRALANRKVSRKRKKIYLTQRGGSILTALLPPAPGVLGSCSKHETQQENGACSGGGSSAIRTKAETRDVSLDGHDDA